ncbi:Outer membrane protein precursor GNA2001 [Neisseria gonorrhoeae]|nr:Outer membrane protein precursor GNA2001 [Neisseria gonorrhoeae]
MDSFFKPAVWAVLWLMFAVRPALADELTNLLSSREQILRQFAEDEQPVLPVNRAPARRAGNADELIGNAMGLNEQPVLPVNRAPARRAGNADELIGSAMGLLGIAYRYGGTSVSTGFDCSGFMQHIFKRAMGIKPAAHVGGTGADGRTRCPKRIAARGYGVFPHARRQPHFPCRTLYRQQPLHPRAAHGENIEITSLSHKYWSGKYAFARRVKKNDPSRFLN